MERVSKYDLKWVLGVYNKWNWGAHDELRYTLPGGPGFWPWERWVGWSKAAAGQDKTEEWSTKGKP